MILLSERIELMGASGALYSFHLADPASLPPRAGAYAIVRPGGEPALVGETESLPTAAAPLERERAREPGARLFIRLIVRRQARLEELRDLLEGCALARDDGPASSAAA